MSEESLRKLLTALLTINIKKRLSRCFFNGFHIFLIASLSLIPIGQARVYSEVSKLFWKSQKKDLKKKT